MWTKNKGPPPRKIMESWGSPEDVECPLCNQILPSDINTSNPRWEETLICPSCFPSLKSGKINQNVPGKKIRNEVVQNPNNNTNKGQLSESKVEKWRECPNKENGCEEMIKKTEMAYHKLDCPYSLMNFCTFLGLNCEEQVLSKDLLDHLKTQHSLPGQTTSEVNGTVQVHQSGTLLATDGDEKVQWHWKPVYIVYEEDGEKEKVNHPTFFLRTTLVGDVIAWTLLVLGSNQMARKFTVTITLLPTKYQSQAIKTNCPIFSIRGKGSLSSFSLPAKYLASMSRVERDCPEWKLQLDIESGGKSKLIIQNPKGVPLLKIRAISGSKPFKKVLQEVSSENPDVTAEPAVPVDESRTHFSCSCDGCSSYPLIGTRYYCMMCSNYDLCQTCVDKGEHDQAHIYLRFPKNDRYPRDWSRFNIFADQYNNPGRVPFEMIRGTEEPNYSDSEDDLASEYDPYNELEEPLIPSYFFHPLQPDPNYDPFALGPMIPRYFYLVPEENPALPDIFDQFSDHSLFSLPFLSCC